MRQQPRRALVMVVDEYPYLFDSDGTDKSVTARYQELMGVLKRLVVIPGFCPILVGADAPRFLGALRDASSPFEKSEVFIRAMTAADVEELVQFGCDELSGRPPILYGITRLLSAMSEHAARTSAASEEPYSARSDFSNLLMMYSGGHARTIGRIVDALDAGTPSVFEGDPKVWISRVIEKGEHTALQNDTSDVTALFPMNIPAHLLSGVMSGLEGDVSKLPNVALELLDAFMWKVNIVARTMRSLPNTSMYHLCMAAGLPATQESTGAVTLNIGAPMWRSLWRLALSAPTDDVDKLSPASLVSMLPKWTAWLKTWEGKEGTAMGDTWEDLLATALGVHINHSIKVSVSTTVNLLDALPFMKDAVKDALPPSFDLAGFKVKLV
ncbi:MAG: hypothetical protein EON58_20395, partial [Alphaproteobacteria bacterium]